MKNLKIGLPLVNGDRYPLEYNSGRELIVHPITDDWESPPRALVLEAKTKDGETVRISIPYDDDSPAYAFIDES